MVKKESISSIISIISENLTSTTVTLVPCSLDKTIEEQHLSTMDWLFKSIKLGLMMEESDVYQEAGINKDMLKLSVYDNRAYPLITSEEAYEINIPQKYVNRIQKCLDIPNTDNIDKWIRRTYFLGLNHQVMNLFQKTGIGYERIDFNNIDISDIK